MNYRENRIHSSQIKPYSYYQCIIPDQFAYAPMHWLSEFEINFVRTGSAEFTCGEQKFRSADGDIIVISFGGSKAGIEAVKEGKLNVTFECNPGQGPKAAELIKRLESDISIDKEQYVEETYFDGTMDLDEIIENRTY